MNQVKILTLAGSGAWVLVDDGDNVVGWVGDDGAEDTSDVTGGESDHQLFGLKSKFNKSEEFRLEVQNIRKCTLALTRTPRLRLRIIHNQEDLSTE